MSSIVGIVKGQELAIKQRLIVGGSVNYITARFSFSSDWNNLLKIAHFRNPKSWTCCERELVNNCITSESGLNLPSGSWKLSIQGFAMDSDGELVQKITTSEADVLVRKNECCEGLEPLPSITPSYGEQVVAKAERARQIAEKLYEDAENGRFDGHTPEKGVDYWTDEDRQGIVEELRVDLSEQVEAAKEEVSTFADETVKPELSGLVDEARESAEKAERQAELAKEAVSSGKFLSVDINSQGELVLTTINEPDLDLSLNEKGELQLDYEYTI